MASDATTEGSAAKRYFAGTHRTIEPEVTLERLRPLLPTLGITRVAVVTGLDNIGIPVVMVCRPNSRSLSVAQGKGTSLAAAKVSGIMESVEGWHGEHILLPLRLATYRELAAVARVVDVGALPRRLSSRFHSDLTILWVEGTDVFSGERKWVPYEGVHLDFRVPGPQGSGCFASSSSGLAAGNTMLEAVSHALCEVVERDAITLWNNATDVARAEGTVDPTTVEDPGCRDLLEAYERAAVGVRISDLTTDVGVPVFRAAAVDTRTESWRGVPAATGYGCHPSRAVALSRALTEAAQGRLTAIAGSRDDLPPSTYRRLRDRSVLRGHAQRLEEASPRSFRDVPDLDAATLEEDVAHELDGLRSAGIREAIVVELGRKDVGIPVVRVVVPGLEAWYEKAEACAPGPRLQALLEKR
ncbi:MAG TPA: YcaO-like family protein [Gaiellaceae bacterium]|nr:YcaO-like family protein [Gaiellaceae bacterium]